MLELEEEIKKVIKKYDEEKHQCNSIQKLEYMKSLIQLYHNFECKKAYEEMMKEYKIRYIYNESKVEGNITPEEQLGIGIVYDYIQKFDFKKDYFNIFTTSLLIHQKLYSKCFGKEFGGKLRTEPVFLKNSSVEIMEPIEAQKYFNSFISKSDEIFISLNNNDILGYIENCVKLTTDLIKVQPFQDGNKRTFRSLLNLLLKKATLPPVYIDIENRVKYKQNLMNAIIDNEYSGIYEFYYNRIEEAIFELDLYGREIENDVKTYRLLKDIKNISKYK